MSTVLSEGMKRRVSELQQCFLERAKDAHWLPVPTPALPGGGQQTVASSRFPGAEARL